MSKTTDFAFSTGVAVARVIASGKTLVLTLWLPVENPPCFAQTVAASGDARELTNARIAGVSRKVTTRAPPISTPFDPLEPALTTGNGATLKPLFALAFVDGRMTPATKSPSNTIAPLAGGASAFVPEPWSPFWTSPEEPPARLPESPSPWPIVLSADFTEASVHLTLCA